MIINRDSENTASGLVDDAEAIAFSRDDIDYSPRNCRSSLETANTIDSTTVSYGNTTSSNVTVEQWNCRLLPPVSNLNDL